eukprot:CAMPEP_0172740540 /NCGR_PEP_ID=MMETSP1074-20121228/125116_1 /TAXON_ID=2916 /ORGANISM="Ceratium fusus, Strain PA161109" /LENGTH=65 /DNA_ID=CAMNT_0013570677 /DNA_START=297 /DNA_END=494 /DNA_ORIENTATION=-
MSVGNVTEAYEGFGAVIPTMINRGKKSRDTIQVKAAKANRKTPKPAPPLLLPAPMVVPPTAAQPT